MSRGFVVNGVCGLDLASENPACRVGGRKRGLHKDSRLEEARPNRLRDTGPFLGLGFTEVSGRKLPTHSWRKGDQSDFQRSLLELPLGCGDPGLPSRGLLSEDGLVRTVSTPIPTQLDRGSVGSQVLLSKSSEVSDPLEPVCREMVLLPLQLVIWKLLWRCCPGLGQNLLSTWSSTGSTIESVDSESCRVRGWRCQRAAWPPC